MFDTETLQRQALGEMLHREVPFDLETIAALFLRVEREDGSFLLESVERGQQVGRYSFVGCEPLLTVTACSEGWKVQSSSGQWLEPQPGLGGLRPLLRLCQYTGATSLPPFASGLVGYVGYDLVRAHERLPKPPPDDLAVPAAILLVPGVLYALDHARNVLHIMVRGDERLSAEERLVAALDRLQRPARPTAPPEPRPNSRQDEDEANLTPERYQDMVLRAKEYIRAGDILQVVLSQRLSRPLRATPFQVYRALRRLNPSPYMFHFRFRDDLALVGSSPEMFVRLRDGLAEQRPLAGTRKRGRTTEEDARLEEDLSVDPKERAEHIMLVDLARNDLGRVCQYGTVSVPRLLYVERFSHVMHLASTVEGRLREDRDAVDLLAACLPAGTLSGAPKVRAMEIIDELEPTRRGPYGGAVGYLDANGNLDTCITLRTLLMTGGRAYVQAGAGIVADSVPASEYQETLSKAAALLSALDLAGTA
ncbi:MAG: anthranilate synthase component I [Anaerolineae bacterium]|nr:anthranilate synthase component I [Anaerolineae bacterium]